MMNKEKAKRTTYIPTYTAPPTSRTCLFALLKLMFLNPFCLGCYVLVIIHLPANVLNHFALTRFADPFLNYPLPPDAVSKWDWTGIRFDDDNGCEFYVERTIASSRSLAELQAYYRDVQFPAPYPSDIQTNFVVVNIKQEELIFYETIPHFSISISASYHVANYLAPCQ